MIRNIFLPFLFLFTIIANGQNNFSDNEFSVTIDDLVSNNYENDTTASAIVIYEFGESYIEDPDFDLIFKIKRKLKILNKKGFDKANITIPLRNNSKRKETIRNIKAITYNISDGKMRSTPLAENDILIERYNKNYTHYKFALPDVQEGSVIAYSYEIRSPFLYEFKSWSFQGDIPKIHSEYNTSIPGNYQYYIKLNGELKPDSINENVEERCVEGGGGTYADCFKAQYIMKNVPSFVEEEFISSPKNYLSRLDYQLRSVQGFNGSLQLFQRIDKKLEESKSFGGQMKKSKIVKPLISKKELASKKQLDRLNFIYDFVRNNYTWNKDYGIYEDNVIKDLIEAKSGNVCQINLLLYNLLQANNIESHPIILSTRQNGLIDKKRPRDSDFNYLIVQAEVEGKNYLLDATDKNLILGQIPFRCLNQHGFLLDFKNGSKWISLAAAKPSLREYSLELRLDKAGHQGNATISLNGHHAISAKKKYFTRNEEYTRQYLSKTPNLEITDRKVPDDFGNQATFIEKINIQLAIDDLGQKFYLNPFLFMSFTKSPFSTEVRTYPVDFGYKDSYHYTIKIDLNDQYKVVEIPKQISLKPPGEVGRVLLNCNTDSKFITLNFKFEFHKAVYNSKDYDALKELIDLIVNLESNSIIVLNKI